MDRKVDNPDAETPKPAREAHPAAMIVGPTKRVIEQQELANFNSEIRCPRCGSWDIRPSQQKRIFMDGVMWVFQKVARRCRVCGRRFYSYAEGRMRSLEEDDE